EGRLRTEIDAVRVPVAPCGGRLELDRYAGVLDGLRERDGERIGGAAHRKREREPVLAGRLQQGLRAIRIVLPLRDVARVRREPATVEVVRDRRDAES